MGLKERRAISDFQNNKFPDLEKEVREAAGMDVPIEVDWVSLAIEGAAHHYEESFPEMYFKPLVAALKSITADEMGLNALKGSLKKIVIQNKAGISYSGKFATFSDGILTLDHKPTTNLQQAKDREDVLRVLLEDNL
ncbi:hypothetical protein KKB55_22640 [Myxococcota bacterium]|nr:hypothetical protein [Myxococcota bacterium]MBU1900553.1 hypothetical protein [Myxococcota bacterium]